MNQLSPETIAIINADAEKRYPSIMHRNLPDIYNKENMNEAQQSAYIAGATATTLRFQSAVDALEKIANYRDDFKHFIDENSELKSIATEALNNLK